jgi:hypothetical protein
MKNKEKAAIDAKNDNEAVKDKRGPSLKFDTSQLKSSYANFCNANSTREEVVLNFGENNAWERTSDEIDVILTHRIVMSPFAAKKLHELLQKLMNEYKNRYGALSE